MCEAPQRSLGGGCGDLGLGRGPGPGRCLGSLGLFDCRSRRPLGGSRGEAAGPGADLQHCTGGSNTARTSDAVGLIQRDGKRATEVELYLGLFVWTWSVTQEQGRCLSSDPPASAPQCCLSPPAGASSQASPWRSSPALSAPWPGWKSALCSSDFSDPEKVRGQKSGAAVG